MELIVILVVLGTVAGFALAAVARDVSSARRRRREAGTGKGRGPRGSSSGRAGPDAPGTERP